MSQTEAELMNPGEVAARLAVSKRYVAHLARQGRLSRIWIGPHTPRYRRVDVDRLLADGVAER